jgi:pimeloyl-ACP methyl ester carboxylesterase
MNKINRGVMNKTNRGVISLMLLLITTSVTVVLQAQDNWASYLTSIDKQGYAGHNFRFTAKVRTEGDDVDASSRLWIRVDREKDHGFFNNMWESPIKSNEWKKYTIEGTIDKDYTKIVFGIICQYNGKFYFDDIVLEVQITDKKWEVIYESDFEKGIGNWTFGKKDSAFKAELTTDKGKNGNTCLLISGEGVPNFGANSKVGKYAEVNGIRLYYEVYGEGHPLVVLHGNGGSIENATSHYPELIKRYKVIAVDSRAQGKSTDTDAPLTYEIMASDISALLDELKIDSAYVWGQSDGAILGLMLAMNHPGKVKKVLAFGANIQPDSNAVFSWAVNFSLREIKESKDLKVKKLNQLMIDHPNVPYSNLSRINIPVLIMAGDRDVIRPEHTLKLFQNIPRSQLCIIPGATHGASWEKKDLFLSLLYDFFDKPFTMPSTEDWYK